MNVAWRWVWIGLACVASPLWADTVELTNGERLQGKVLSLDGKQLEIASESLGKLVVPREKVGTIALGDRKLPAAATSANQSGASPLAAELESLFGTKPGGGAKPLSVEEILKQLQAEGTTPQQLGQIKDLKELQKAMPLLADPEVQAYFNKTVGGLMNGTLKIDDIRQEAIKARDQLKDAIKDLGPEGEQAVGMYLRILDGFIKDTAPANNPPAKAAPQTPGR
jgi:hypothetical protein